MVIMGVSEIEKVTIATAWVSDGSTSKYVSNAQKNQLKQIPAVVIESNHWNCCVPITGVTVSDTTWSLNSLINHFVD